MFKIVKKNEPSAGKEILIRIGAVFFALAATAVIVALLGFDPIKVYAEMIKGSVATAYRFRETINKTIPLVILSLGIAVAFKMKFWNIGAEGQFYMGAFGAAWVAFNFNYLHAVLLIPAMILAGLLMGGLWALIPAVLKAKFETNETLVTLMMNYVAIKWVSYLQYGPWKDPKASGFPKMPMFTEAAILPKIFGVNIGWIIALVLTGIIYVLFKHTKMGYEIAVIGENETTARYAGMNVARTLIWSIMLSGGLCGLAGMIQSSGIERSLTATLSGGLGFTAIITTWLSRLSPPVIIITSFLFAMLLQGGAYIQTALQIPATVAGVLQGTILFFVLGSEFFTQYKLILKKKTKGAAK